MRKRVCGREVILVRFSIACGKTNDAELHAQAFVYFYSQKHDFAHPKKTQKIW